MTRVARFLACASLWCATVTVAWAAATPSQAPGGTSAAGTITGVVRRVTGGGVLAGRGVQLVIVTAQGPQGMGEGRIGADGRFAFHGLPDGRYLAQVVHQDVVYVAPATITGGARADIVIEAYDVADAVPLRATFVGVAVDVLPGYVQVSEIVHLRNATTRTFLGEVRFSLPPRAQFVTFQEGWQRPQLDGDRLRDRVTVRPGTYRLAYGYRVPGTGAIDLDRQVTVPIDQLEVFTLAPAETRGPALTSAPAVTTDGRVFSRASARGVAVGPLALRVVGVPAIARWPAPAAASALAGALALGLGVAVTRARRRAPTV